MATKKQKRLAGIAKREAEEQERRTREQHFLQVARDERRREREKADALRKERAIAKSKRLAKDHQKEKQREAQGVKKYKPAPVAKLPRPVRTQEQTA